MSDQFKKYVDQFRDDFDELEPSADVLKKIKLQMGVKPEVQPVKKVKLFNYKWAMVAMLCIVALISIIIFNKKEQVKTQTNVVKTTPNKIENPSVLPKEEIVIEKPATKHNVNKPEVQFASNTVKENIKVNHPLSNDIINQLTDSTSSSNRLSAILNIEKTGTINNQIIDHLAKTLNNDENSNVRSAALNLLGKYANDSHVSNVLKNSFTKQKDPVIQLGLINLLGNSTDEKVEKHLYALTNDPNTMDAVKDEAYMALLNQNKL